MLPVRILQRRIDIRILNASGQVPLVFNHCLTAIRFKAGFDCTIKSITINGAYASGSYIIGGEWTGSGNRSFTIDFGSGKSVLSQGMITDGENTLMLIPQTLGTEGEVVVVYNSGQRPYVLLLQEWNGSREN